MIKYKARTKDEIIVEIERVKKIDILGCITCKIDRDKYLAILKNRLRDVTKNGK